MTKGKETLRLMVTLLRVYKYIVQQLSGAVDGRNIASGKLMICLDAEILEHIQMAKALHSAFDIITK